MSSRGYIASVELGAPFMSAVSRLPTFSQCTEFIQYSEHHLVWELKLLLDLFVMVGFLRHGSTMFL